MQNITESFLTVTPSFQLAGAVYPATPASLAPGQSYKLELRKELRKLGLQGVTSGGIELTYQGEPDGIRAHGVLFNGKGFSAEVDFLRRNTLPAPETFFLRAPRFAFGPADPALGLSPRTAFNPYVVLHNFGHYPMSLGLKVGYADGSRTQEVGIPVALSSGATQIVALESYLAGIPPRTHWANLEIGYSGTHNNLAASMVSVSQDGKHSIRSVLNWVEASNREGWHWQADREFNTIVSIQNSDTEPAEVIFSLDYQDRGVSHSYDLPPFTIPARGTHHVNIGEIIAAGVPRWRWRPDSARRGFRGIPGAQNRRGYGPEHYDRSADHRPAPRQFSERLQHRLLRGPDLPNTHIRIRVRRGRSPP